MYKLMLATEDSQVLAAVSAVTSWEMLGFREPRIVPDYDTAVEKLQKHHVDAVIMDLPQHSTAALTAYLNEHAPLLPILYLESDESLYDRLSELSRFLGHLSADNSDDRNSPADNLRRMRHAFFRHLISGEVKDAASASRKLGLLRSRMDPDAACMLVRFELPKQDDYLAGRWHYGNERLEIAMRNIFGAELYGMRLLVSVLQDDSIYLLACPMRGSDELPDGLSMSAVVTAHAESAVAHVAEYLGIDMKIESVNVLSTVTALADGEYRKALGIH